MGMENKDIMIVNNTGQNIGMFTNAIIESAKNNSPLPEEISDVFSMKITKVENSDRPYRIAIDFI